MLHEDSTLRACKDPVFLKRFFSHVDQGAGCWLWTSTRSKSGYGYITLPNAYCGARTMKAARVSWIIHNGARAIPDGMLVLHSCDNPPCVNPAHLRIGTQSENILECVARGRHFRFQGNKTHCLRGHPFDDKNTRRYMGPSGPRRVCRACHSAAEVARKAAKRASAGGP